MTPYFFFLFRSLSRRPCHIVPYSAFKHFQLTGDMIADTGRKESRRAGSFNFYDSTPTQLERHGGRILRYRLLCYLSFSSKGDKDPFDENFILRSKRDISMMSLFLLSFPFSAAAVGTRGVEGRGGGFLKMVL